MVELSSVLSELRREFGIAPGAEVPRRLVAEAITRRLQEEILSRADDPRAYSDVSASLAED